MGLQYTPVWMLDNWEIWDR